jgi:hypothetical protein
MARLPKPSFQLPKFQPPPPFTFRGRYQRRR